MKLLLIIAVLTSASSLSVTAVPIRANMEPFKRGEEGETAKAQWIGSVFKTLAPIAFDYLTSPDADMQDKARAQLSLRYPDLLNHFLPTADMEKQKEANAQFLGTAAAILGPLILDSLLPSEAQTKAGAQFQLPFWTKDRAHFQLLFRFPFFKRLLHNYYGMEDDDNGEYPTGETMATMEELSEKAKAAGWRDWVRAIPDVVDIIDKIQDGGMEEKLTDENMATMEELSEKAKAEFWSTAVKFLPTALDIINQIRDGGMEEKQTVAQSDLDDLAEYLSQLLGEGQRSEFKRSLID